PREIIAIFGQSIGPAAVSPAPASTDFPPTFPNQVTFPSVVASPPTTSGGTMYQVMFAYCDGTTSSPQTVPCHGPPAKAAPIIMVSNNQINAVVPVPDPLPTVPPTAPGALQPNAWVQVVETTDGDTPVTTDWFPVTYVSEVPGVFTFGGLGLGQAAVLNYDATAGYSLPAANVPAAPAAAAEVPAHYLPPSRPHRRERFLSYCRDHRRFAICLFHNPAASRGRNTTLFLDRDLRAAQRYDPEYVRPVERHTLRRRVLLSGG